MPTIEEMIQNSIAGAEEGDPTVEMDKVAHQQAISTLENLSNLDDMEKLASTLEFVGTTGVGNLVKTAGGTSHAALQSNDAAQNLMAQEHQKNILPGLKQYFDKASPETVYNPQTRRGHSKVASELSQEERERLLKEALATKLKEKGQ